MYKKFNWRQLSPAPEDANVLAAKTI